MRWTRPNWGIVGLLTLVALSAVGCGNKEKETIAALREENLRLTADKDNLGEQLAMAREKEAQLLLEMDAGSEEAASYKRKIASLEADAARTPSAPVTTSAQGWEIGVKADRITVGGDILFSSGKVDLTQGGKSALDRIIRDLKSSYAGLPVRVLGYTDTDPIRKSKWKDNLELSAHRAMAVVRYLASKGIAAKTIETIGMGEHHPIAGSKSRSRRVEIVVVKSN